jgi:hypothetical protein
MAKEYHLINARHWNGIAMEVTKKYIDRLKAKYITDMKQTKVNYIIDSLG